MNTIQFLMAILNWMQADPSHLVVAASALAALTPTPAPNTPWGRAYKVLELLAINFMHAKETGVNAASVAEEVAAILAKQQAPSESVTTVKAVTPASPVPVGITPTV
jgi:hypothetical protein